MNRVENDFERNIILPDGADGLDGERDGVHADLFALDELAVEYDAAQRALWTYMTPSERPSFTPEMLSDFERWQDLIESTFGHTDEELRFLVLGSRAPGVWCYGGDLALFRQLIIDRDRAGLVEYGHRCCRILHRNINTLGMPMLTIGLVQGAALGGGLEALLSFDYVVAEESATFGLPEIMFGLFPGMGAHALLSRKIGTAMADRMIISSKTYSAAEMHAMGLVHHIVPDGTGVAAVEALISKSARRHAGLVASRTAMKRCWGLTRDELYEITEIWADTALKLTERDLKLMARLVAAQEARADSPEGLPA